MTTPTRHTTLHAIALALWALGALSAPEASARTTRGDFDRPPFYNGKLPTTLRTVAHVAVTFRDETGSLDPTPAKSPALAGLLDSLRAELDRAGRTRPLATGDEPMRDAPAIRFGVRGEGDGPPPAPGEPASASRRMTFTIDEPGRAWRERVKQAAGDSVDAVLVVQLGFSDQWVRQTSWKGSKSIELGTGRSTKVEWLTSLDVPVQVLQLTGALVTREGRVVRVGSEGLIARRTGMAASVLGAQETLREEELASVLASSDGGTAAWRDALRTLVSGLLEPVKR